MESNIAYRLRYQDWALLLTSTSFKFSIVAFYMIALFAMLKDIGFDLTQLSWIYLLGIFEIGKFIISPLIEYFRFDKFGKFRTWLFISNFFVIVSISFLYFIDPIQQYTLLLLICLLLNFSSLIFGCATLGLTCAFSSKKQYGTGGVVQVIAGRLGKVIGGAVVLFIYQYYGWNAAVSVMLVSSLLLAVQILLYVEPKSLIQEKATFGELYKRFVLFWKQPNNGYQWLIILFLIFIPSGALVSTFVPSLSSLGWKSNEIGVLLSVIEPILTIFFTPLSALLLRRYSYFNVIFYILLSQVIIFGLFSISPYFSKDYFFLMAFPILLLSISYALLVPCLLTVILDKSNKNYPTLDSSLQFSIALLGGYLSGFFSLRLANIFNFDAVYYFANIVSIIILILFFYSRKNLFN
ncbi:MFS transporter [Ursidibacter sp. B-7004-1]